MQMTLIISQKCTTCKFLIELQFVLLVSICTACQYFHVFVLLISINFVGICTTCQYSKKYIKMYLHNNLMFLLFTLHSITLYIHTVTNCMVLIRISATSCPLVMGLCHYGGIFLSSTDGSYGCGTAMTTSIFASSRRRPGISKRTTRNGLLCATTKLTDLCMPSFVHQV